MSEFTITKVSAQPPRSWSFNDRRTGNAVPMVTYKVMLEGIEEPVDLNRKPGMLPAAGEVLVGALEESDFGKKFKPERKPFAPGSGKDSKEIRAEWAIGQANAWLISEKEKNMSDVEPLAKDFFAMVDRVKDSGATAARQVLS